MNICEASRVGCHEIKNISQIPELEADILLAHILNVSRTYLFTWPEKELAIEQEKNFFEVIKRRKLGEPIAYICGRKEFWSLNLAVSQDVLIPRQETELLVEQTLKRVFSESAVLADLGTGSGAIALALAISKPNWQVHATDNCLKALSVAEANRAEFKVRNLIFHAGDWCKALPQLSFDAIVSNPPYIAVDDVALSSEVRHYEPTGALIASQEGLAAIEDIVFNARNYLKPSGLLLIEHGYQQGKKVTGIFEQAGYTGMEIVKDLAGLDRVTIASWQGFGIN